MHAQDLTQTSEPTLPDHQGFIHGRLPAWLIDAGPETHRALRSALTAREPWIEQACHEQPQAARALRAAYAEHQAAEADVQALLAPLPDLNVHARQLLEPALKTRFELTLDVRHTFLLNLPRAEAYRSASSGFVHASQDPFVVTQNALKLATQSLLHSALQNFEAAEAEPGGLEVEGLRGARRASVVQDSDDVSSASSARPIALDPQAFAALARELDIGGRYQRLIEAIFNPAPGTGRSAHEVQAMLRRAEQAKLCLHVHRAYLQGALDLSTYASLLDLARHGQAEHHGKPVLCAHMNVLQARLTGAVTFAIAASATAGGKFPATDFPDPGWLVLYLPGTAQPLTVHHSRAEAEAFVLQQLQRATRPDLLPLLADRDQHPFLQKLQDTLTPLALNAAGTFKVRTPDPDAKVSLHLTPFAEPLFEALVTQRKQRLQDDALFHAVPTAAEDRKTAEHRRAYFLQLGLTALNIGALFLPALRLPMLLFSVAQLGYETFEGLVSWAADEREQAFAYLLDVAENVALIAALGAAEHGAGVLPARERIPVETPSFIEELQPITLPDGTRRLWRPDLRPFAHDVVLPAGLQADEFGLYHHDGKTWLALDGSTYEVEKASGSSAYHARHPSDALSYRPPLRHNGAGAWLSPLDDPQQWQGGQLLRRFGQRYAVFDDACVAQLLHVTGLNESVLRRALTHLERAPALLEDSALRLTLDQQVHADLPTASSAARAAEFQRRYQALPRSQAPGAELLQRVYPQLPTTVVDELLRHLSADPLQRLSEGTIPLRLGEEVRVYQQQIRLARAVEGLYLHAVRNPDSDLLILAAAQRLQHWPSELNLAFVEGKGEGTLLDSLGPAGATRRQVITRYPNGYTVSSPFPGSALLPVHDTLFSALEEVLGVAESSPPGALRRQLQQAAASSREQLRLKLGMQRRTFVSPLRLADGRFGYPLSPTPSPKPLIHDLGRLDSLNRHLRQLQALGLQPAISNEILGVLAELPLTHAQVTARIAELPVDTALELETSLARWRAGPDRVADPDARAYSRDMIEIALWRHWINQAVPEAGAWNGTLVLGRVFVAEFPAQLPARFIASVRGLHLVDVWLDDSLAQNRTWAQIEPVLTNLLAPFAHLQQLIIERPADWNTGASAFQHSLALIAERLPSLRELRIVNQGIALTAQAITRLATLAELRWLDLSGNRLVEQPALDIALGQLQYLGLEHMALRQWPSWLSPTALEAVEWVSLRGNGLTEMPYFLRLNEISTSRTTVVSLQGNPLDTQQMLNLAFSEDGLPRRFRFELALTPAVQLPLQLLLNQRNELRQALDHWFTSPLREGETAATRIPVARELSEFWESRVRGLDAEALQLNELTLEHFPPVLPAFFYRWVDHLILEDLNASAAHLDTFLRRFPNLTSLALFGNLQSIGTLPAALSELPLLTELELVNQGLVIDDDGLRTLLQLPALESLDLSDNTLSPAVRGPFQANRRLTNLSLNNTGMTLWPDWLYPVMPTQTLDLGDNRITHLPEAILEVAVIDQAATRISLSGNPLEAEVRAHVERGGAALTLQLPHGFRPR